MVHFITEKLQSLEDQTSEILKFSCIVLVVM
jgi:hypothetical protein